MHGIQGMNNIERSINKCCLHPVQVNQLDAVTTHLFGGYRGLNAGFIFRKVSPDYRGFFTPDTKYISISPLFLAITLPRCSQLNSVLISS